MRGRALRAMPEGSAERGYALTVCVDATGAVEASCPVATRHVVDAHSAAARIGMHELVVTHVDADVGKGTAERVEKHQIARLQTGGHRVEVAEAGRKPRQRVAFAAGVFLHFRQNGFGHRLDVREALSCPLVGQRENRLLGVIENLSYFIAPDTGSRYNIFGEGGGQKLADEYNLNFLGQVPIGFEVREGGDRGVPVVVSAPDSAQSEAFRTVAEEVARHVSIEALKPELVVISRA